MKDSKSILIIDDVDREGYRKGLLHYISTQPDHKLKYELPITKSKLDEIIKILAEDSGVKLEKYELAEMDLTEPKVFEDKFASKFSGGNKPHNFEKEMATRLKNRKNRKRKNKK